jgi:hypothetical protein
MTSQPWGSADLTAVLAAIRNSPIIARLSVRLLDRRKWASVRNSPDVDAFVLAWIASHVQAQPRRARLFM